MTILIHRLNDFLQGYNHDLEFPRIPKHAYLYANVLNKLIKTHIHTHIHTNKQTWAHIFSIPIY